jgi:hypothetical protein
MAETIQKLLPRTGTPPLLSGNDESTFFFFHPGTVASAFPAAVPESCGFS